MSAFKTFLGKHPVIISPNCTIKTVRWGENVSRETFAMITAIFNQIFCCIQPMQHMTHFYSKDCLINSSNPILTSFLFQIFIYIEMRICSLTEYKYRILSLCFDIPWQCQFCLIWMIESVLYQMKSENRTVLGSKEAWWFDFKWFSRK